MNLNQGLKSKLISDVRARAERIVGILGGVQITKGNCFDKCFMIENVPEIKKLTII